jgi:anti-sigma B factor antagonist
MSLEGSRLHLEQHDLMRIVVLRGEVDSHTAGQLEGTLDGLGSDSDVVLDVGGVEFIDSSGLRVIINAHQSLDESGHRLVLRAPSEAVTRLLAITGLLDRLHVDDGGGTEAV